jgi:hypothetical protein
MRQKIKNNKRERVKEKRGAKERRGQLNLTLKTNLIDK